MLNQIKMAFYAFYLTNKYGFKFKSISDTALITQLRLEYSETLLSRLNISIEVVGAEKIAQGGQYLVMSNHRSIIDPLIVEVALKNKGIHGAWVAKKELYNSFFFGSFTRNGGSILLDRESKQMAPFFKDIKGHVKNGHSICVFPEGTRNKSDKPLTEFKEGSQIIAIKNKLQIIPMFIKSDAHAVLMDAIKNNTKNLKITIEVGDLIDAKDRSKPLQEIYMQRFGL